MNTYTSIEQKKAQLQAMQIRLTKTAWAISGVIATIVLGSCVSQPTIKPNQGQSKQTVQLPNEVVTPPPSQPSQNHHTIINTGQMQPQTPQYQTNQRPNTGVVVLPPAQPPQPLPQTQLPQYPQGLPTGQTTQKSYTSFSEWQQDFLQRTSNTGLGQLVANAHLSRQAISQDKNQAEFITMIWDYVDKRTTAGMVAQGQQKRRANLSLFDRNEAQYGVPASIVTAIWGIETGYSSNMGSMDLVDSLSTLAYEGRRRQWAEGELLAMSQMVVRGDVLPNQFRGSYAGGMGHTQFIPSTWLKQGVDGDGDGKISPFVLADALTSTASYLANAGWVRGLPAYVEVSLPSNFDYQHIGSRLSLSDWQRLGISGLSQLDGRELAELWLPAGIMGPALLVTKNFEVIKVYNNSSNYALAVAVLAQKLNGKTGIDKAFPRHEQGLSKEQIKILQRNLTAQGYDTGGMDGIAGTNTRRAFAKWQLANGQVPDGFISQRSAGQLVY